MPHLIFVSYTESDKAFVDDIFIEILNKSLRRLSDKIEFQFYREAEPRDTAQLADAEIERLETAAFFIAVTSPQYVSSKRCKLQWEYFIEHRIAGKIEPLVQMVEVEIDLTNPQDKTDIEKMFEPLREQRGSFFFKLWWMHNNKIHRADEICTYQIEICTRQIELRTHLIEEIADRIMTRICEFIQLKQAIKQVEQQVDNSERFVFIDAAPQDKILAEQIKDSLRQRKINCVFPITLTETGKLSAQKVSSDREQSIKRCTAMLIVRGAEIPLAWVEQHYQDYQKIKSGRNQPLKFLAICEEKPDPLLDDIMEEGISRLSCSPVELSKFMESYNHDI
jgi:hypothetical protein